MRAPTRRRTGPLIAYFSAEFGLHEALPIYSGGLGILSGDHCKTASDLELPFVGVGFLYPQGYFEQRIDADGRQQAVYEKLDFAEVPATPALGPDGQQVMISVDLPGRKVYAKVWRIQVGRVPLYLMDTDVEQNAPGIASFRPVSTAATSRCASPRRSCWASAACARCARWACSRPSGT